MQVYFTAAHYCDAPGKCHQSSLLTSLELHPRSNAPYTPTRNRSHQPVPPRVLRQMSGLDNARHERCLALADEADGITDAFVPQSFSEADALYREGLKKMNIVRKIVGKSLRKLTHYMSMLNCIKYNIAPTEKKLVTKRDENGIEVPDLTTEGFKQFDRSGRPYEPTDVQSQLDWDRGFAH